MENRADHLQGDEDIEEILKLAVRSQGVDGSTLRDLLQSSATELGITPEALAEAERQWAANKQSEIDAKLEAEDRKLFRKMKRGDLLSRLGSYVAICALVLWIDGRDYLYSWSLWVIAACAVSFGLKILRVVSHNSETERQFQKWRKKKYQPEKPNITVTVETSSE